jgi:hypothetical protein
MIYDEDDIWVLAAKGEVYLILEPLALVVLDCDGSKTFIATTCPDSSLARNTRPDPPSPITPSSVNTENAVSKSCALFLPKTISFRSLWGRASKGHRCKYIETKKILQINEFDFER